MERENEGPNDTPKLSRLRLCIVCVVILLGVSSYVVLIVLPYSDTKRIVRELRADGHIELLTLDPNPVNSEDQVDGEYLGAFKVIDARVIDHAQTIRRLTTNLVGNYVDRVLSMRCFLPRHAIRSTADPDIYVLICFECHLIRDSDGNQVPLNLRAKDKLSSIYDSLVSELEMNSERFPLDEESSDSQ